MGVGSGLGTFRGQAAGVWPPLEKLNLDFSDMSCPDRFLEDDDVGGPTMAWSFWKWRHDAYTGNEPHAGYRLLRKWADSKGDGRAFVFTSNIDGHFERAGFENQVIECHGTLRFLQCQGLNKACPQYDKYWETDHECIAKLTVDPDTNKVVGELPKCPGCGGVARPTVLMFGDWYVVYNRIKDQRNQYKKWLNKQREHTDENSQATREFPSAVVIEIGAGVAIPTVREECEEAAMKLRCPLIRINPEKPNTPSLSGAQRFPHVSIAESGEAALLKIDEAMAALLKK